MDFGASVATVLFATGHKNPTLTFRFTAILAMLLIVALSIFAASPALHRWVHASEHVVLAKSISAVDSAHAPIHPGPDHATEDHEDGCAIALFAAGVVAIISALLVWLFIRRTQTAVIWPIVRIAGRELLDWLPPLCGPPAN